MPSWTYAQVKEADAGLDINDPVQAAAALNAQTITQPPQSIRTRDAAAILLRAPTYDWAKIVLRSRGTISNPGSPTPQDMAVYAAITATAIFENLQVIDATNETTFGLFVGSLTVLAQVGDISPTVAVELGNLRTPVVPRWEPPLSENDVVAARQSA